MEQHIDGFDKYGPVGLHHASYPSLETLLAQEYNLVYRTTSATMRLVDGLGGLGQALEMYAGGVFNSCGIVKTLRAGGVSRLIGGMMFKATPTFYGAGGVKFYDTLAPGIQCTINILENGTIALVRGDYHQFGANLIAASAASILEDQENTLAFDVEIGNAAAYHIWLNGIKVLSSDTEGLGDTQLQSVARCTDVRWETQAQGGGSYLTIDHLWLATVTDGGIDELITEDAFVETTFPIADTADDDFAKDSIAIGNVWSINPTSPSTAAANFLHMREVTVPVDMTLNDIRIVTDTTSVTAKFKAAVYDSDFNLLSDGTEVVGCTADAWLTLPLATPQALLADDVVYIGFYTDTARACWVEDDSANGWTEANTYASGAAASITPATNAVSYMIVGIGNGFTESYAALNGILSDGDHSYVSDTVVGERNMYEMGPLSLVPTEIYTTAVKALTRKSETGTRLFNLLTKSGATVSEGDNSPITVGTSYTWLASFQTLNPDGDIPWTEATHQDALLGFEIDT